MRTLNQAEAETFQQFLNGEELWSWPNGRVQLGQTFPDLAIINRLMRKGFLDEHHRPTELGRLAFQSWVNSRSEASAILPVTPQTDSI